MFKKRIIIVLTSLILTLVILEIWVVNRLATYGDKINQLEKTKSVLKTGNNILKNQIAQKSSLREIEKVAKVIGFQEINKVGYIKDLSLALNH